MSDDQEEPLNDQQLKRLWSILVPRAERSDRERILAARDRIARGMRKIAWGVVTLAMAAGIAGASVSKDPKEQAACVWIVISCIAAIMLGTTKRPGD